MENLKREDIIMNILDKEVEKLLNLGYTVQEIWAASNAISERRRLLEITKSARGWHRISKYEQLSSEFIREFADKLDWRLISQYQNLDSEIIEEFADRVDWFAIFMNQDNIDHTIFYKYRERIRNAILNSLKGEY